MATEAKFRVDDIEFRFVNHLGGTEEIYVGDELVSSFRSLIGGKHKFVHAGDSYEVKVKVGLSGLAFKIKKNGQTRDDGREKLPAQAYLACGWPLAILLLGGALGGGLGGAAAMVNFAIYRSTLPVAGKVALNVTCGAAAIFLWAAIGGALRQWL